MYRGARCFFSLRRVCDAFTVYTPCVWVRTSGVCVITVCVCVAVWSGVLSYDGCGRRLRLYVMSWGCCACPFAVARSHRVWRVGGATDYYLFFRAQGRMDNHCEWAMISYTAREKDETAPSTVQS